MKVTKDNLNKITIKSYIKHFGLKIKDGFIYKKDIAIYTEPLEREQEVLSFLMGISSVIDNNSLWFKQKEMDISKFSIGQIQKYIDGLYEDGYESDDLFEDAGIVRFNLLNI